MAQASITFTCEKCGEEFVVEQTMPRWKVEEWEAKAKAKYKVCKECYKRTMIEKAVEQEPIRAEIIARSGYDIDTWDTEFEFPYLIIFYGTTIHVKETLKELGAKFNSYVTNGWGIACRDEEFYEKMHEIKQKLGIDVKNQIIPDNIVMFQRRRNNHADYVKIKAQRIEEKRKQYMEEKQKLGEIPKFHVEEMNGAKWNGKFYGKAGRWSVYLDGDKFPITDDDKLAIENTVMLREEWELKNKQVELIIKGID